jgi:hypothetical protein
MGVSVTVLRILGRPAGVILKNCSYLDRVSGSLCDRVYLYIELLAIKYKEGSGNDADLVGLKTILTGHI